MESFENILREIVREEITTAVQTAIQNLSQIQAPVESGKNLHSLAELAEFIGCSITTAQRLKNSGRIRFYQVGRKVVFKPSEVLEDIRKNSVINRKSTGNGTV